MKPKVIHAKSPRFEDAVYAHHVERPRPLRGELWDAARWFFLTLAIAAVIALGSVILPAARRSAGETRHGVAQLQQQIRQGYAALLCFGRLMQDVNAECPGLPAPPPKFLLNLTP
jgi:hypothetical protein